MSGRTLTGSQRSGCAAALPIRRRSSTCAIHIVPSLHLCNDIFTSPPAVFPSFALHIQPSLLSIHHYSLTIPRPRPRLSKSLHMAASLISGPRHPRRYIPSRAAILHEALQCNIHLIKTWALENELVELGDQGVRINSRGKT